MGIESIGRVGAVLLCALALISGRSAVAQVQWRSYARDPQHTALSQVPAQRLSRIRWQTPVDLSPPYHGTSLFIHYGSPLITPANTVIIPVRTSSGNAYRVEGRRGIDGSLIWSQTTDYILPPHNWIPSMQLATTNNGRVYFPGAGGTILYRDSIDSVSGATGRWAFYGLATYQANTAALNSKVFINTPITADASGNLWFGFQVTGANPAGLVSGLARIDANGNGSWVSAVTASGDAGMTKIAHNCAPALSLDGNTLYVAISNGTGFGFPTGYLVSLNSTTLAALSRVLLRDPNSNNLALIPEDGTASPTIGPDGDVYFGVLENPFPAHNDRGWLLHFSSNLGTTKTPGGFGWDDTASIVPATMVPSYTGGSSYLVMTKYNNYAGVGNGDGVNKIAVFDPGDTQIDPLSPATVMKEVMSVAGPTPDTEYLASYPNAVREWCINTAAVDPFTKSIMANCEDGKLYRWDMTTNTLIQPITLTSGIGEAYTPTVIGVDGTVYAINNAILFAVGTYRTDLDDDNDADGADMQIFIDCMTGSDLGPPATACIRSDLDGDNDVDQADFGSMQRCQSGPSVTPAAGC